MWFAARSGSRDRIAFRIWRCLGIVLRDDLAVECQPAHPGPFVHRADRVDLADDPGEQVVARGHGESPVKLGICLGEGGGVILGGFHAVAECFEPVEIVVPSVQNAEPTYVRLQCETGVHQFERTRILGYRSRIAVILVGDVSAAAGPGFEQSLLLQMPQRITQRVASDPVVLGQCPRCRKPVMQPVVAFGDFPPQDGSDIRGT